MDNAQISSCWQIVTLLGLICATLLVPAVSQDFQCTISDRSGVDACNFNYPEMCGWIEQGKEYGEFAWLDTENDAYEGPFDEGYEDNYIFLDPVISGEQPVKLESAVSAGVSAICVKYYYATSGPVEDPINFYLYNDTEYLLMHEFYTNTDDPAIYMSWQSTEFECCLPNVESGQRRLALEATSHEGAIVAIDYIDIRNSEATCDGENLVCVPTPPSLTTATTMETTVVTTRPVTASPVAATTVGAREDLSCPGEEELGAASCDFGANGDTEDFCGWSADTAVWEIVVNGSGEESYLVDTTGGSQSIESDLSTDIESVCMEVQFSTETPVDSLAELFHVYLSDGTSSELWWVSYDYSGSEADVWKTNSFSGCLGTGPSRKIILESHQQGLMIHYIRMRKADLADLCDTASDQGLLSCPASEIPVESFCGFSIYPEPANNIMSLLSMYVIWVETLDSDVEDSGYYMTVYGSREDLTNTPATLTSRVVETSEATTLSFSYYMSGQAEIKIKVLKTDGSPEEEIHSTNAETGGELKPLSVRIYTTGQYQVIFEVSSNDAGLVTEETVQVTFGDILQVVTGDTDIFTVATTPSGSGGNDGATAVDPFADDGGTSSQSAATTSYLFPVIGAVVGVLIILAVLALASRWRRRNRLAIRVGRYNNIDMDSLPPPPADFVEGISAPVVAVQNMMYTP